MVIDGRLRILTIPIIQQQRCASSSEESRHGSCSVMLFENFRLLPSGYVYVQNRVNDLINDIGSTITSSTMGEKAV